VRRGKTVVVHLTGQSGAGKSALLRRFLDGLSGDDDTLVLSGQCHEQELVPYKGFDSLIDRLGRHLKRLPEAELGGVLPRDFRPLARVFPVLRPFEANVPPPRDPSDLSDPQDLRRRAFGALRELFGRLGDRRTLVLAVDDLQWADPDSASLLAELLSPPDPPVLLFLASFRSEDRETSPFLRMITAPEFVGRLGRSREVVIGPMSLEETEALAVALLGGDDPAARRCAAAIARESAGSPLFVQALVRHVQSRSGEPAFRELGDVGLDEVLWREVSRLPDEARRLLEVLAVAGRPLRFDEACRSSGVGEGGRGAFALLRSCRMARRGGSSHEEEIETYHDRVRETVVSCLAPEVRLGHHRQLARTLELMGTRDPEILATHYRQAGEAAAASKYYAMAAHRADESLAFHQAAGLFRDALELHPPNVAGRRELRKRLGDSLAKAGLNAEAAREYLELAGDAEVTESLRLRQHAAMLLLLCGRFDEGLSVLQVVLKAAGMALPATRAGAIASVFYRRTLLRLRGLSFRERGATASNVHDIINIDICWSVVAGLSAVDPVIGSLYQARGLLLSLRAGEPYRVARALSLEATHLATAGRRTRARVGRLLATADALATRLNNPHAAGLVSMARGMVDVLLGAWHSGAAHCRAAEAVFAGRCADAQWVDLENIGAEVDHTQVFLGSALTYMGDVHELAGRFPKLTREARERDDVAKVANLVHPVLTFLNLAADDPERARRESDRAVQSWTRRGMHVQHHNALRAQALIDLYCGDGAAAWHRFAEARTPYERSLLTHVQYLRVELYEMRARSALAASASAGSPRRMLSAAEADAHRLERERVPWARAFAALIRAGVAAGRGRPGAAADRLVEAAARFEALHMAVFAAAARRRLGEVRGGPEGRALVAAADLVMTGRRIMNPDRFTAAYAPGFQDVRRPTEVRQA